VSESVHHLWSLELTLLFSDDIFLARALEGTTFASARDIVKLRSYPEPPAERAAISDHVCTWPGQWIRRVRISVSLFSLTPA
jgi:hypothetical protein